VSKTDPFNGVNILIEINVDHIIPWNTPIELPLAWYYLNSVSITLDGVIIGVGTGPDSVNVTMRRARDAIEDPDWEIAYGPNIPLSSSVLVLLSHLIISVSHKMIEYTLSPGFALPDDLLTMVSLLRPIIARHRGSGAA
jgi:hypothetical protein